MSPVDPTRIKSPTQTQTSGPTSPYPRKDPHIHLSLLPQDFDLAIEALNTALHSYQEYSLRKFSPDMTRRIVRLEMLLECLVQIQTDMSQAPPPQTPSQT